ncbi:non-ribosomal peptide synthetase [Streptomyces sp. NBC_01615]|uniref:non-ribosomal peptide synthetase n=1 Tax=Streptomyces sp. NBC_01615 TaxID=2975898 RepID=UPI00386B4D53
MAERHPEDEATHRLTPGQADLYAADQQAEFPATYNSSLVHRVDGALDEELLRGRFARLLTAHPLLASRVVERDGALLFAPARRAPRLHTMTAPVDPEGPLARARLRREVLRPFDLERGPLLHAVLVRYTPRTADLVLTAHHLVVDETSMALIAQWLLAGEEATAVQSFAEWADGRHQLPPAREERAAALRAELAGGVSCSLDWARTPAGGPAPTGTAPDEAVGLRVPEETWEGAAKLAAELGITQHSLMTAAAALVLGRNSGTTRPVLGAAVSRRTPRHAATVGYFNATVPVPLDLGPVSEVAPAGRRPARSPTASRAWEVPPLAAPGESPSTSSTRASARHAESTLPHSRLRSSGGTPMTPPGPPSGRTTPLPTQALDDEQSVADWLRRAHRRCLDAYRDADLPLSSVLPATDRAGLSLVVVPCRTLPEITAPDLIAHPLPDPGFGPAQFPLALYLRQDLGGELRGLLRYRHDRVDAGAAEQFCRQLEATLTAMVGQPHIPLGELSVLPPAARARLLTAEGPTGAPEEPGGAPSANPFAAPAADLPTLFAARAARLPDRTAVVCENERLTYQELDERSTALALALAERNVRHGDRVGVCLERGLDLVVALLAVLKAGAAYVPLDPGYPQDRLAFIAEDTGLATAVTDRDPALLPPGLTLLAPTAVPTGPDRELPAADPERAAYVIHTSGSTGTPKGVVVRHRNVTALLAATAGPEGFAFDEHDVWSFFHSFAFDFSVWEIWGCLLTGGRLVVVPHWSARDPERFHALLARERVTVLNQTPSAFAQLLAADESAEVPLSVRLLIFGGEPLEPALLLPWFDRYPERVCRAVNMYGITETTVHCTWRTLTRADALNGTRSVGRALPGWRLYVLDEEGRPAAPGVPGEIHVSGAGVAAGYLNRPELTEGRFVRGRLAERPDELLYRSGDRGRLLPDGELEHLGRLDDQVKIRGHRIELGEIRGTLLAHSAVTAAAAVVRDAHDAAAARIDAYLVTPEQRADTAEIRQWLAERLPAHVLPATLTVVPALPLTANGKLDAARLPVPSPRQAPARPAEEPSGRAASPAPTGPHSAAPRAGGTAGAPDTAHQLCEVWQQLLGVPVGVDDNFFEMGGNSLLAVRLNALQRSTGFTGSQLKDIFRNPTPRRLAAVIGPPPAGRHPQEEA